MSGQLVQRTPTPQTQDNVVEALRGVWGGVLGDRPTSEQLGLAWGQIAVETMRGKYIFNYNVGNITYTPGCSYNFYEITDSTSIGGDPTKRKKVIAKMRSYPNLMEGVEDYLRTIKNFPERLKALKTGNPVLFAQALAATYYYDPALRDDYMKDGKKAWGYTSSLSSLQADFLSKYKAPINEPGSGNKLQEAKTQEEKELEADPDVIRLFNRINKLLDRVMKTQF